MNRIVWKDNLREIRKTWPRFLSIFAITLLGVAFLVGIKVASPSMIETATSYFDAHDLSDGQIVSTQGITQEDLDALNQMDEIHALGLRTLDTTFYPGSESIRIYPYTPGESDFYEVVEGRLPEASNEIALDSMMPAQNPDWKIGSTIKLKQVDDLIEDADDLPDDMTPPEFAELEYEVVGFVDTPYYYERFTRGMKMDGKGDLAAFGVVTQDAISGNLNTEAYWWMNDRPTSYSDEYITKAERLEDEIEEVLNERSRDRFNELQGDFRQEILDGQDEIDDGYKKIDDAEKELKDKRKELDDGYEEYEEGQAELADAQAQIADGRAQLDSGWADANAGQAELASSRQLLQEKQAEYESGRAEYEANLAKYNRESPDARKKLEDSQAELKAGQEELKKKEQEFTDGKKEYEKQKATYDEKVKELEQQLAENGAGNLKGLDEIKGWVNDQLQKLQAAATELKQQEQELTEGIKTLTQEIADKSNLLEQLKAGLPEAKAQVAEAQGQLDALLPQYNKAADQQAALEGQSFVLGGQMDALRSVQAGLDLEDEEQAAQFDALEGQIAQLAQSKAQVDAKLAEVSQVVNELAGKKSALEQGIAQGQAKVDEATSQQAQIETFLTEGQAKLDELQTTGKEKLAAAKKELETQKAQAEQQLPALQSGIKQLTDGDQALKEAKAKLDQGEQEIAKAKEKITRGQAEIDKGYEELNSAKAQLDQAQQQLASGKSELDNGWAQLADGEAQLSSAFATLMSKEDELADAMAQYQEGLEELAEAKTKLEDGEKEWQEANEEFEEKKEDSLKELEEAQEELDEAKEKLDELESSQFYLTGRDRYIGYETVHDNADKLKTISNVFPILFFLIAVMVTYMTITRMAQEQRNYMGTMEQMGYTTRTILWKFIIYAGSASLFGALLGVVIGYAIFPPVIMHAYNTLHYFDHPIIINNHALNIVAVVLAVACAVIPAIITPLSLMRTAPANLLLPPPPKAGDKIFLERWTWFWDRLSFTSKMTLRNLSRYRGRALLTILGVGGCMVLIVTGFGISDSVSGMVDTQFDQLHSYDYIAVLEDDVTVDEARDYLDEVDEKFALKDVAGVHSESVDATVSGRAPQQTQVIVPLERLDDFKEVVELTLKDDEGIITDLNESGPVVTEGLVSYYDLKPGDTLTFEDEDFHLVDVEIDTIGKNYMGHYLYMSPEDYREHFKQDAQLDTMFLTASSETDRAELEDWFGEQDWVMSLVNVQSIRQSAEEPLKSLDLITLVLIVSAASLSFVVLYNLLNINISERIRELSTIKVLGFYTKEVTRYIFDEIFILTAFGAVFGAVGGYWLNRYILIAMSMDDLLFHPVVHWSSYIYAIILTYLFVLVIMFVMNKKIKDIDMVEALKAVD